MEKENAQRVISDAEFVQLLKLVRSGDQEAMYRILQLFEEDIQKTSRYIRMSREDAVQSIVTDFIEELRQELKTVQ
ncbi:MULTISPECIES: helix-turn-helix domain-containing protein [Paenibacillus]|uniref:Helix-turn-helix domain-containing protein n=1 Tax=Paenibacillus peoriae TaxID=59893 RepID=A0A7H0Y664_9BACL|nr:MULTISPECIES: helix-turn-helix domain-containing protein [Paenibacillus]MDY7991781.1 helix-turn-helix domain-containing protein [Paenibacillus polymyxa]MDY8046756.1 helix-turn-helix domain-containing protein [Paenibacillus polymyxa]MDY8118370.1 helix-turn-helix domain-containing protein [Paenibacillus polymyxa]QNR66572.1 helix-turn-helix domain-containing protein [Paenibacillus peoriae]